MNTLSRIDHFRILVSLLATVVNLSVVALPAAGGLLDGVLDSVLERKWKAVGKKNDAWYAANKDLLKINLNAMSFGTNQAKLSLAGTIENLSDDKISSVIIDIIIVNKENKLEALRERMRISVAVFKSERFQLGPLERELGESEIVSCLHRIKEHSWSYEVVTFVSKKVDDESTLLSSWFDEYYKVRSVWKTAGK